MKSKINAGKKGDVTGTLRSSEIDLKLSVRNLEVWKFERAVNRRQKTIPQSEAWKGADLKDVWNDR